MNPYVMLGSGTGTTEAAALSVRLSAWHDAMVAHERRVRTGRTADVCDDECPHAEARALWSEALALFGSRAHELAFLWSRATDTSGPASGGRAEPHASAQSAGKPRRPRGTQTIVSSSASSAAASMGGAA
jgi:hypothetical protein